MPAILHGNQPCFDSVARPYRWLEYLTLGPLLERCRYSLINRLGSPNNALVLGDGDGRFLARLLRHYPKLNAHVLDLSPAMLRLAGARASAAGSADRVTFQQADLRVTLPLPAGSAATFDVVAAHFLLDCLTTEETASLIDRLLPLLGPDSAFLISEFAIPGRQPFRFCGWLLIFTLYRAFALLTGLRVRTLPVYTDALHLAGFQLTEDRTFLGGILRSELWRRRLRDDGVTQPQATPSSS